MEIGRGVEAAEERRRVQRPVPRMGRGRRDRADVVSAAVEEIAVGNVARSAGPVRHPGKAAVEDRLPPLRGLAGAPVQGSVARQQRRRQEVELVHIGDQRVEHQRRRFRPAQLAHDDVPGEFAEARHPAVPAVRRGEADAAQARHVERVEPPVIAARIEEAVIGVDAARAAAEPRHEQRPVDVAPVVAGRTGEAERAGARAQDLRRIEQHVAVGDEKEPLLVDSPLLEVEHQAGQRLLFAQRASRRKAAGGRQGRRSLLEARSDRLAQHPDQPFRLLSAAGAGEQCGQGKPGEPEPTMPLGVACPQPGLESAIDAARDAELDKRGARPDEQAAHVSSRRAARWRLRGPPPFSAAPRRAPRSPGGLARPDRRRRNRTTAPGRRKRNGCRHGCKPGRRSRSGGRSPPSPPGRGGSRRPRRDRPRPADATVRGSRHGRSAAFAVRTARQSAAAAQPARRAPPRSPHRRNDNLAPR